MSHKYVLYRMVDGRDVITAYNGHRKYEGEFMAEMVMDLFIGTALHSPGTWEYVDCRTIINEEGETITFDD